MKKYKLKQLTVAQLQDTRFYPLIPYTTYLDGENTIADNYEVKQLTKADLETVNSELNEDNRIVRKIKLTMNEQIKEKDKKGNTVRKLIKAKDNQALIEEVNDTVLTINSPKGRLLLVEGDYLVTNLRTKEQWRCAEAVFNDYFEQV